MHGSPGAAVQSPQSPLGPLSPGTALRRLVVSPCVASAWTRLGPAASLVPSASRLSADLPACPSHLLHLHSPQQLTMGPVPLWLLPLPGRFPVPHTSPLSRAVPAHCQFVTPPCLGHLGLPWCLCARPLLALQLRVPAGPPLN